MSGEPLKTRYATYPAPIDGINLSAPIDELKPTEALALTNYWIYDTGIRQASAPVLFASQSNAKTIGFLFPFIDTNGSAECMYGNNNKIYLLNTSGTSTDRTGAAVITVDTWNACYFNKHIILLNGTDTPLTHDLAAASNVAAFSAVGPTVANLKQGTGYRSRLYLTEKNSTKGWYGDVGAFAGTFTAFDYGDAFQTPGNLLCQFNWTYNQGDANQEFLVALNESGEALIYGGTYPGDTDTWTLVGKAKLPKPKGAQPFVKVAGDVYVMTERGMIPMSTVFAGKESTSSYYSLSRKIKNETATTIQPAVDNMTPFLYAVNAEGSSAGNTVSVYVLNYERSAWSRLFFGGGVNGDITCLAAFNGWLLFGTNGNGTTPSIYKVDPTAVADSTTSYTWTTPHYNFGVPLKKAISCVRILGLNYGNAGTFWNQVYTRSDMQAVSTPAKASVAVDANTLVSQELRPGGVGNRNSFLISRIGDITANEKNEIQGIEIFFDVGGAY